MPPSNLLTGPASSGRLVCAPRPMAISFYRRPVCREMDQDAASLTAGAMPVSGLLGDFRIVREIGRGGEDVRSIALTGLTSLQQRLVCAPPRRPLS